VLRKTPPTPIIAGYGALPVDGRVTVEVNEIDFPPLDTLTTMFPPLTDPVTVDVAGVFTPSSKFCSSVAISARRHVQSLLFVIRAPLIDVNGSGSDAMAGSALNAASAGTVHPPPENSTAPAPPSTGELELDPEEAPPSMAPEPLPEVDPDPLEPVDPDPVPDEPLPAVLVPESESVAPDPDPIAVPEEPAAPELEAAPGPSSPRGEPF
jgi:hypothetical protein